MYGYLLAAAGVVTDETAAPHIRMIDALDRQGLSVRRAADEMKRVYPLPVGRCWKYHHMGSMLANRHLYRDGRRGKRNRT